MSTKDLTALESSEIDHVKHLLLELSRNLQEKKGTGSGPGRLLPDEVTVMNAITHPERGDVLVTVVRNNQPTPMVFVSNRRDANSPFSVMDAAEIRSNPGRRTLDGSRLDPEQGKVGLFLSSVQDQDLLRSLGADRVDIYSVHFGLSSSGAPRPTTPDAGGPPKPDLKVKPLAQCTRAEKWTIYKSDWEMDPRRDAIEEELFTFMLTFAKYKQAPKEERLVLSPTKHAQMIGQMIRDIYPPNVRRSLVRDFPADHNKQIELCHRSLLMLVEQIQGRIAPDNGEEFNSFLSELKGVIEEILKLDPDLTRF